MKSKCSRLTDGASWMELASEERHSRRCDERDKIDVLGY